MPVSVQRYSLGIPPLREITRGSRKGQLEPQFEVSLPGWDDIIHIGSEALLSDDERDARRRERLRVLAASPVPQIAQHFEQIATQIDNIQDALVVLSVGGRVVTAVVGRAIPGVGQIATAADVLNAINIFYPATVAKRAVGFVAREGEALAGRVPYKGSKAVKRAASGLAALSTGTYRQRLAETLETGKVGFGWGEALQALQVTDQFTGYGLALGPIFGALEDSFFGFLRGARFDVSGPLQFIEEANAPIASAFLAPFLGSSYDLSSLTEEIKRHRVTVDWPGVFPTIDDLYGQPRGTFERDVELVLGPSASAVDRVAAPLAAALVTANKALVRGAATVWNASKWLVGVRGDLSWEDHVSILAAQHLALGVYRPFLQQMSWGELAHGKALELLGAERLPFVTTHTGQTVGELTAALRDGSARAPLDWIDEAPGPEAVMFSRSLVSSFVDLLFHSLEGSQASIERRSPDPVRALIGMHDLDLLPPYERSDAETASYIQRVSDLVMRFDSKLPRRELVERAWLESFVGGVIA